MTPHAYAACDIPHSPPSGLPYASAEKTAAARARVNDVARRDPSAVLGVLEFWLKTDRPGDAETGGR